MAEAQEQKAKEGRFDYLHNLVTEELIKKMESKEATHQEVMAAIQWLKTNGVDSPGRQGSPITRLAGLLPEIDPEEISRQVNYGPKAVA